MSIRGTELTPAVRVTLAHELTHALQDQHVDLSRLDDLEGEEGDALRAIGEGDADRIEDTTSTALSDDDHDAYEAEQDKADEEADSLDEKVPPGAPVAVRRAVRLRRPAREHPGRRGRQRGRRRGAAPSRRRAARCCSTRRPTAPTPPTRRTSTLSAPDGVDELDDGTLGALAWYLMLSRRIDPKDALAAADGWGGDHYVLYRDDDGSTCLDVAYEGDTSDDVDEMHDALDEWIAAGDEGDASVETTDEGLRFHACDPGEDADTAGGDGGDDEALRPRGHRGRRSTTRSSARAPTKEQASCFADGVARPLHDRPAARRAGRVHPERRGPGRDRGHRHVLPVSRSPRQPWSASMVRPSSWVR